MLGFINIYKPSDITSNKAVQMVKKKFGIKKIGHLGTLDPMASGILPLAIGRATRLFDYFMDKTKRYIVVYDFGYTTDTLDITGTETERNNVFPTTEMLEKFTLELTKSYDQLPPKYSAKNVLGRRAYDLAREGIEFELTPKNITIHKFNLVEKISDTQFKFDVTCSSGTYIRSLGRDLAELFGGYACMSYLERVESGFFVKSNSIKLDELLNKNSLDEFLISPVEVFKDFDRLDLDEKTCVDIMNGKKIEGYKTTKNTFVFCKNELVGVAKPTVNELKIETYLNT